MARSRMAPSSRDGGCKHQKNSRFGSISTGMGDALHPKPIKSQAELIPCETEHPMR